MKLCTTAIASPSEKAGVCVGRGVGRGVTGTTVGVGWGMATNVAAIGTVGVGVAGVGITWGELQERTRTTLAKANQADVLWDTTPFDIGRLILHKFDLV